MYILVHVCIYTKDVNLSLFVSKFVFTFLSSFDTGQVKFDVLLFFSDSAWICCLSWLLHINKLSPACVLLQ